MKQYRWTYEHFTGGIATVTISEDQAVEYMRQYSLDGGAPKEDLLRQFEQQFCAHPIGDTGLDTHSAREPAEMEF